MLPVHRLEHNLVGVVAVEDQSDVIPVVAGCGKNRFRNTTIEQPTSEHPAVHRSLHRAAADDQGDWLGKRIGHWSRERIAATSDECHVDASGNCLMDGVAICRRQVSATVEERPVDIDTDQPNHVRKGRKQAFVAR